MGAEPIKDKTVRWTYDDGAMKGNPIRATETVVIEFYAMLESTGVAIRAQ
ncbi:MAG TPA: hypothetical protein VGS17_05030 [Candidatus Limnocylindria bacterium]|nr:hypothetical protein [Candidatus Limnocylindria bacterium]